MTPAAGSVDLASADPASEGLAPAAAPSAADPALRDAFLGLLRALAADRDLDPEELEQRVWLRAAAEPRVSRPESRLRALTLQEFHGLAAEEAERELPGTEALAATEAAWADPEPLVLAAEQARELRAAVNRLPSRCPALLTALLESPPLSYRELAEELSMPYGSIGPTRSRCLGCLRRLLAAKGDGVSPRRPRPRAG